MGRISVKEAAICNVAPTIAQINLVLVSTDGEIALNPSRRCNPARKGVCHAHDLLLAPSFVTARSPVCCVPGNCLFKF